MGMCVCGSNNITLTVCKVNPYPNFNERSVSFHVLLHRGVCLKVPYFVLTLSRSELHSVHFREIAFSAQIFPEFSSNKHLVTPVSAELSFCCLLLF